MNYFVKFKEYKKEYEIRNISQMFTKMFMKNANYAV